MKKETKQEKTLYAQNYAKYHEGRTPAEDGERTAAKEVEKESMLEEIAQHKEKILSHLFEIEYCIKEIGNNEVIARMDAYWLPSIKGALGDEAYPNTIMTSLEDTIEEIKEEK